MPAQQDLFGQLWKEYALSDSRYMTSDPFVLCMESTTALLWGPLSFLAAYMILTESPFRHPVQSLVSVGQIYGDVLYYATNTFDIVFSGVTYSRPEFVYFWFYYVIINSFWITIPGCRFSRRSVGSMFGADHLSQTACIPASKRPPLHSGWHRGAALRTGRPRNISEALVSLGTANAAWVLRATIGDEHPAPV